MNLYQHAKNQTFSSFYSRDIVDLKFLQSDWPPAFWAISHESDFSQNSYLSQICISMKEISSFHLFIFEIQEIFETQHLKDHAHFQQTQCKNY